MDLSGISRNLVDSQVNEAIKNTALQELLNNTDTLNMLDILSSKYDDLTEEQQEQLCENNYLLYQETKGPINIWNYTILMPW